jgi:ribosomal protein S18 acetylase RimI-like enzyme
MDPALTAKTNLDQQARANLQPAIDATVVAASTTKEAPHDEQILISYPPRSSADDSDLVTHLTTFINAIYLSAEATFWTDAFVRTNEAQIRDFIRSGSMALAWRNSSLTDPSDIVGCVYIKHHTGDFGMLCCDPAARGTGVGRRLLRFAEEDVRARGGKEMRLEVLQGKGWTHEFKARLEGWYVRNGYVLTGVDEVDEKWPDLAKLLAKPAVAKCYRKEL